MCKYCDDIKHYGTNKLIEDFNPELNPFSGSYTIEIFEMKFLVQVRTKFGKGYGTSGNITAINFCPMCGRNLND